jgi:hypothetical protein
MKGQDMSDNIQILNAVKLELDKLVDQSKQSLNEVKAVAVAQAWKILQLAVALSVQLLENIAIDLSGPDKKIIAMNAISTFYDKMFTVIDIPLVPNILEPIMHKYMKAFLMALVGASIDATVTTFRQVGVFKSKDVQVQSVIKKVKAKKSTKKRK